MKSAGMQPFAITQALRIWPRDLQGPFMQTATSLGDEGLTQAMDLLAEIDKQSKSGIGEAAENVERFILSMAAEKPQSPPGSRSWGTPKDSVTTS